MRFFSSLTEFHSFISPFIILVIIYTDFSSQDKQYKYIKFGIVFYHLSFKIRRVNLISK